MSDENDLSDEAPPETPDISSDPPPAPSSPPVASEPPDAAPSDLPPDSEPDPFDIEVEEEEVEVHVAEPVEVVEDKPVSKPPPRRKRGKRNTIPQTPVARASVRPPEPVAELTPDSLRPPKAPHIDIPDEPSPSAQAPQSAPPRAGSEPPRPGSVPPRPASVPPRPVSAPPRALSDPPEAPSRPPSAKSEPPAAKSEPPEAKSEPPRKVSEPPPTTKLPSRAKGEDDEESPWPPLTQDDVERDLAEHAAAASAEAAPAASQADDAATDDDEESPPSAATSYPPPPMQETPEPRARPVKAARIIHARKDGTPAAVEERSPVTADSAPADSGPLADTPVETPAATVPLPGVSSEPPVAAPATPQELEGAEELTDDDIAPESDEPPPPAEDALELRDSEVGEEPEAGHDDIDVVVEEPESESAEDGGAKPPPPPRRSAFEEARRVAQQKAEARRAAEEAKRAAAAADQKRPRRAWWEELFGEDFARAAGTLTDSQVTREADFIEESLGIAKGGVVLDLGCGAGYHAVDLARRGYGLVGYDLSLHQLALAADVAQQSGEKLNLLQGDMREMAFEEMFDGIYCWNTSFGYFEEDKNYNVAERIFRALRPGGMFLLDVANRDFVVAHQPGQTWFEGDACVCMDDMNVDFITSRLRVKRSLILDDGRSMECNYSIRLYGLHELGKILHDVGFRVTEASGHPSTPGVFFGASSPRIIILAQRP